MKVTAYRLVARRSRRTASLVMSSFFPPRHHAPIGWYPILLCHGKIKRAFSAASHLGNPYDHRSSAIDPRPITEPKRFPHDKTVWRAPRNVFFSTRRKIHSICKYYLFQVFDKFMYPQNYRKLIISITFA